MATRCYYDVLGVHQGATASEIKKCYHAQALRWHPDKNAGDAQAADVFKQVQEAYEVLSDPQERAYYDDNRDQVLMSDEEEEEKECHEVEAELDLYKWSSREAFVDFSFDVDGFFSVYSAVFQDLHTQEKTAKNGDVYRPGFGGVGSDEDSVTQFYAYWLNFSTCRSDGAFANHDKWDLSDAPSPLMRRLMQQKNKAIRDKAREMFNDKVRRLTKWVKSQDPRSCGPVCAVADTAEGAGSFDEAASDDKGSFHCAACNKWYKNAGQLSNHEKSTKHKQTVARVRRQLQDNEDLWELEELGLQEGEEEEQGGQGDDVVKGDAKGGGKGKKKKGRRDGLVEVTATEESRVDAEDEAITMAMKSTALPSPADVALQTRQAFENSEEYKKMNKTQRRKALQQWEAENEHIVEALRKEGKEPKPEAIPREKKPDAPAKKQEKVHGSGAHSREIKTPKKKKAVYGKVRGAVDEEID